MKEKSSKESEKIKIEKALDEVIAIYQKYDLAGAIILAGEDVTCGRIHLSTSKSFASLKGREQVLDISVNMRVYESAQEQIKFLEKLKYQSSIIDVIIKTGDDIKDQLEPTSKKLQDVLVQETLKYVSKLSGAAAFDISDFNKN